MGIARRTLILSAAALLLGVSGAAAQSANSFDFITHNEVVIGANPDQVWPHLRNVNAWKMGTKATRSGGTRDAVGEKFAAAPEGAYAVSYFIETVEIAPPARWTIRLNTPDGALMGYATWTLSAAPGGTLVRYDTFLRSSSPGEKLPADAVSQLATRTNREAEQRMDSEFARLKRLVEGK